MKKVCENIRLGAPKIFHEVCQWTAFFNCASRIYIRDGAGFQLDGLLYPYYKKGVEDIIVETINKTVPGKHPSVHKDCFLTDKLTQSEAVALGRALAKIDELKALGKPVTIRC